jgi:flagellar motility protein MotE (MotC chaperone)
MRAPRLLPLLAVAAGGVLAVKGLASVEALPSFMGAAQAWAEESAQAIKEAPGKLAANGKASPIPPQMLPAPSKPPAPVCAPTAAELAREAGLSPAELQLLQSLGARRGQLDQREKDFDTQLALMAAAEGKLDAKIAALRSLRSEIKGLMDQADAQKAAEVNRLVTVYQAMKPRDAAARMTLLADEVRLPIAAKMKERPLAAIIAQMPPVEAKALTEKLAARFDPKLAAARAAIANTAATAPVMAPAGQPPAAAPAPAQAAAKPPVPAPAKPAQLASLDPVAASAAAPPAKPAPAKAKPKPKPKPKAPPKPQDAKQASPKPDAAKAEPAQAAAGPKPYLSLPSPVAPGSAKPAAAKAAEAAPPARGDTSVPVAPAKPA